MTNVSIDSFTQPPSKREIVKGGLAWYYFLALEDDLKNDATQLAIRLPCIKHADDTHTCHKGMNNELVVLSNKAPSLTILEDHKDLGEFRRVHFFSTNQDAMIETHLRDGESRRDPKRLRALTNSHKSGLTVCFDREVTLVDLVMRTLNPERVKANQEEADRLASLVAAKAKASQIKLN